MQWIMRARVDRARELLEETDLAIEEIAATVGLGTATNLRRYFRRVLGTTPTEYRRTFSES
jgi:transcriptional regulator GlxA family with amidase domain